MLSTSDSAEISLVPNVEGNERILSLYIQGKGFIGIHTIDFEYTQKINDRGMTIEMKGFVPPDMSNVSPLSAAMSFARANVPVDLATLASNKSLLVDVILNGKANHFSLQYETEGKKLTLDSLETINVTIDQNAKGKKIILAPLDVGYLSTGNSAFDYSGKNYHAELGGYAKKYGFIPADQEYKYIKQDKLNILFVKVPKESPIFPFFDEIVHGKKPSDKKYESGTIYNQLRLENLPNPKVQEFKNSLYLSPY